MYALVREGRQFVAVGDSVVPPSLGRVTLVVASPDTLEDGLGSSYAEVCMPVPTVDELEALRRVAFSSLSVERFVRRLYFWGPIPRYVFGTDALLLQSHLDRGRQIVAAGGVHREARYRTLLVRANMEDPNHVHIMSPFSGFMQSGKTWFTSQPWLELAMKAQRRVDGAKVAAAALTASVSGSMLHTVRDKRYKAGVKRVIATPRTHVFRIRQLGVAGVEGEVELAGGAPTEWSKPELARLVSDTGPGVCRAPLFPKCDTQAAVGMLCRLRSRDAGWQLAGAWIWRRVRADDLHPGRVAPCPPGRLAVCGRGTRVV